MLIFIKDITISLIKKICYQIWIFTEKIFNGRINKYDFQTFEIIRNKFEFTNVNCIDVGANKGYILGQIKKVFKDGRHFAIEPIPHLAHKLRKKYKGITIFNNAVSNYESSSEFTYFPNRPALSGFYSKQSYNNLKSKQIQVDVKKLDDLIPNDIKIGFIKIDVEGAEYRVLKGAKNIITKNKPKIIFEFSINRECTAEEMFELIEQYGLEVSVMEYYIKNKLPLNKTEFIGQCEKGYNFYFIAHPKK